MRLRRKTVEKICNAPQTSTVIHRMRPKRSPDCGTLIGGRRCRDLLPTNFQRKKNGFMKPNTRMGLSILTSGLTFVGSAGAVDLIINGSFEEEGRVPSGSVLTGWTGFMGTYNHSGEVYYAGPPIPASE